MYEPEDNKSVRNTVLEFFRYIHVYIGAPMYVLHQLYSALSTKLPKYIYF